MARRTSNRTKQRATNINNANLRRGAAARQTADIVTTTGRRRNASGRSAGPSALFTPRGTRVKATSQRAATRGEATRFPNKESVSRRAGQRALGHVSRSRQKDLTTRRKSELHSRSVLGGVNTGGGSRSSKRRAVFVSSGGKSKSGARSVFNRLHPRDKRGRFRSK